MNTSDFDNLLKRYLDHTVTPEERSQLLEQVRSGLYDDRISRDLFDELYNEMHQGVSEAERSKLDNLYHSKIYGKVMEEGGTEYPLPVTRSLSGRWWMAAAVALFMLGFWWVGGLRDDPAVEARDLADQVDPVSRYSGKQLVHLPDGSTVLLNEGSELTYNPAAFGIDTREVELKGEGYFEVKKDPSKIFRVRTGKIMTTVLGTAFNVRSIPGSSQVKVTVTRGRVRVSDPDRTYDLLSKDQEIVVNTDNYVFVKKEVVAEEAVEWKDNFLILDNITMREAISLIENRFGVEVTLANEALNECHISASFFNGEDLDHVLKVVSTVNGMRYVKQSDGVVQLSGGGQCK